MKQYKNSILILILILIIIATTFFISRFCFQLMLIQGKSMEPTYRNYQLVGLVKIFDGIEKGDVVAFKSEKLNTVLIKRVVATPKDTVLIKDEILYVNSVPSEFMCEKNSLKFNGNAKTEIVLSDDEYYMLGDNYENSKDSRYTEIGCVKRKDIIGKVYPKRF